MRRRRENKFGGGGCGVGSHGVDGLCGMRHSEYVAMPDLHHPTAKRLQCEYVFVLDLVSVSVSVILPVLDGNSCIVTRH